MKESVSRVETAVGALVLMGAQKLRALVLFFGLLLILMGQLAFPALFNRLDNLLTDLAWQVSEDAKTIAQPVVIAVDESSLQEIGSWPWSRKTFSDISNRLADYGVAVQAFDVVFPESKSDDELLAKTLEQNGAIIGQIPYVNGEAATRVGVLAGAQGSLACGAGVYPAFGFLGNTPALQNVATGHLSPIMSIDGAIRELPALVCVDGLVYPSLAVAVWMKAQGDERLLQLKESDSLFRASHELSLSGVEAVIPLNSRGELSVSYALTPEQFQVFSVADLLAGRIPDGMLRNRVALVGGTAFGLGDLVPTPYAAAAPGVEVQARVIDSLLRADIPHRLANSHLMSGLLTLFLLVLLLVPASVKTVRVIYFPAMVSLLASSMFGIKCLLLLALNVQLPIAFGVLYLAIVALALALVEQMLTKYQRAQLLTNLNAYLPGELASRVGFSLPTGYVEAQRERRILMSADIRNFSSFEESRPPEETAALLHLFMIETSKVVDESGGVIEELKGDSLLLSWPLTDDSAKQVFKAAREIHRRITGLLISSGIDERAPLALGIGVESGDVLLGSLGPSHRKVHAILGDTVTRVIRLQEMTEELAQPILFGSEFSCMLDPRDLEDHGSFLLPGLRVARRIYSPAVKITDSWEQFDSHLRLLRGGKN